ncbi:MAG TPA: protocatechuate 3,4-dioxygenase subunit alpha [Candidatus Dormibacteraeota bacterium]|nr:protocatechuate 3,4-dioxygenase subunit alpha [Candidatus Dormibacteraeota bacterium]
MTPTPSQTVGPFFGFALPFEDGSVCAADGVRIEGQVLDGDGEAVPDAMLEVSADDQFGRCRTDEEGAFHFVAREPRAGFLSVAIFARGLLRHLNTRIYFPGREGEVPPEVDPARHHTLIARREGAVLRFDVRLQGTDETVFFT